MRREREGKRLNIGKRKIKNDSFGVRRWCRVLSLEPRYLLQAVLTETFVRLARDCRESRTSGVPRCARGGANVTVPDGLGVATCLSWLGSPSMGMFSWHGQRVRQDWEQQTSAMHLSSVSFGWSPGRDERTDSSKVFVFILKRKSLCSGCELLYGYSVLVGIELVRSDLRWWSQSVSLHQTENLSIENALYIIHTCQEVDTCTHLSQVFFSLTLVKVKDVKSTR